MKTRKSDRWTSKRLVQSSEAMGSGYMPGLATSDQPSDDTWTTQRHLHLAMMKAQGIGFGI